MCRTDVKPARPAPARSRIHIRRAGPAAWAAVAVLLLAGCSGSKQERVESGLKKGAEFVRLGDWDKANVEVRNVLQIEPKSAQAYVIAAQLHEGQQDVQRAFGAFSKALELKPELTEARLGLARIYMQAGDIPKADAEVQTLLTADAANPAARTLHAALTAQGGKTDAALAEVRAVIDGAKTVPVDATMVLAGLLSNQGRDAEALAAVERALKDDPRHLGLLQVAATLAAGAAKDDPMAAKADSYYKTATQEAPKNNGLWRAWAGLHLQRGNTDGAEAVLRQALAALPGDSRRTLDLLNFLASHRGVAVAEKAYAAAIAAKPREMPLRFGLVNLYRSANRPADMKKALEDIAAGSEDPASQLSAKAQLSRIALAAGHPETARTLVAEMLKTSPRDGAALLLRGRLSLLDGKADLAVQDLRPVAKDQPGSPEVVGLLAQAHRAAGETQLAREVLSDAVRAYPADPNLRLLLVKDMVTAKEFRSAAGELESAIKVAPQLAVLYEAKSKLALTQNDQVGAERALQTMKARFPQEPTPYLRLGQLYTQQNRNDAALKEYEAAMVALPQQVVPYIASVGLLSGLKRFDAASALIDRRQQADPKNVLHPQLRGEVALARKDLAAAEAAYRSAIVLSPSMPVGYVGVARVLALRNDAAGAMQVLEQGSQAVPNDASILEAKADGLLRAKRNDEAIAIYESLMKGGQGSDSAANNLAFLLTEIRGDRASVERAVALVGRFAESRNPRYLDSLGWAHHKLGQHDKAVALLEQAVALEPASPLLNLHLGQALLKSGNVARGKEFLRKAIDSKADLPNLDEAKAVVAQG